MFFKCILSFFNISFLNCFKKKSERTVKAGKTAPVDDRGMFPVQRDGESICVRVLYPNGEHLVFFRNSNSKISAEKRKTFLLARSINKTHLHKIFPFFFGFYAFIIADAAALVKHFLQKKYFVARSVDFWTNA